MTDSNRMGFSNRLDLDRFFFHVREQIYVIVKLGDFPNYYKRSDIDVFCYNKDEFAKQILNVGNCYLDQGFEIRVTDENALHTYVDFYLDGELEFRFDLYQSLPKYERIRLKQHYIYSVIENASVLHREFDGVQYPIYVPSTIDELLLRYVEYIEWYELRPDKVKHLDYILDAVASDSTRIGFLDKLHLYTELPSSDFRDASHYRISAFGRKKYWMRRIWSILLNRIPRVFLRRLHRVLLLLPKRLYRSLERYYENHVSG
jgi:hypothetical protein